MKLSKKLLMTITFGVVVFLAQSCGKDTASKSAKGGITGKTGQTSTTSAGGSTTTTTVAGQTATGNGTANIVNGENPTVNDPGAGAGSECVDTDLEGSSAEHPEVAESGNCYETTDDDNEACPEGGQWVIYRGGVKSSVTKTFAEFPLLPICANIN